MVRLKCANEAAHWEPRVACGAFEIKARPERRNHGAARERSGLAEGRLCHSFRISQEPWPVGQPVTWPGTVGEFSPSRRTARAPLAPLGPDLPATSGGRF